jgi:hypothetical protein
MVNDSVAPCSTEGGTPGTGVPSSKFSGVIAFNEYRRSYAVAGRSALSCGDVHDITSDVLVIPVTERSSIAAGAVESGI